MALFVSYSSRDGAALAPVTDALRRAHLDAWLDHELSGGEAWWNAILEQIRLCEVFVAALSRNYLESKPCQAELRYAQELNRPILPVQIGPLDSMRVNPLASIQVIDYQNPSIDVGIELIAAVHTRRSIAQPLPSPLPDPPPVPFAYLLRLNNALAANELTAAEQAQMFSDLTSGLDADGGEPTARRDLIQLLMRLRDRHDITWKTRTDVEKVLTTVQAEEAPVAVRMPDARRNTGPSWTGPPPQNGPAAPAYPSYPTGAHQQWYGSPNVPAAPPRKSRKPWIIAGSVVGAAVGVAAAIFAHPSPPPQPKLPTIASSQLSSILLNPDRISTVMNGSNMPSGTVSSQMSPDAATVSPAACLGVLYTAQNTTYAGSGWSGVADQVLNQKPTDQDTTLPHLFVDQTAVIFSSADKADGFFKASAQAWKTCAGQVVSVTDSKGGNRWNMRELAQTDKKLALFGTQDSSDGWGCQHTMSVMSNLVVEVVACSLQINDQSSQILDEMIANATH